VYGACPDLIGVSLLLNALFPVAHPLSLQPLTKCSSRNSFALTTIHFHGGCTPLNEEIMNSTTTNSSSTVAIPAVTSKNDSARCQHRFANGKRCRNSASNSHFGLCLHHFTVSAAVGASRQPSPSDSVDLSAELLPELSEFSSGADIRQFLARLLIQVTKGRVSPRRASVLAYITNQLLHSHRAIDREIDQEPVTIIVDGPRPIRD
jgi:hypothetical protein